jgi:hypothetical protein
VALFPGLSNIIAEANIFSPCCTENTEETSTVGKAFAAII